MKPILKQITNNLRKNIRRDASIFKCPGSINGKMRNQCCKKLTLKSLKIDVKWEMYTDILRITHVLESNNRYVCPSEKCGNIVEVYSNDYDYNTRCNECKTQWCRMCACVPNHEGMSCIENEAKNSKTENGKYIWSMRKSGNLKFCPQCKTPTLKNGGCNKMVCCTCKLKWCWLCKTQNVDYDHYNIANKLPCGNKLWE